MQMRIRFSHIPLAALAATLVAGLGCQSAKKPAAPLLPVSQGAPPPVQSKSAAPAPSGSAHPAVAPVKPTPQTAIQAPAKPDPVQELVTKAETAYKAGLDLSLAGHPDEAKDHFDRAFSLLLGGPPEMRSDP